VPDPRQGKRGHLAEELIERACLYYRSQGLALITKAPTPVTVLSGGRAFFKAKAISDFVGVMAGSGGQGIPVALEVKSSRNVTRFRLDEEVIVPHQVAYLNDTIALGGVGAYLFLWSVEGYPRCSLASLDQVEGWLFSQSVSIPFSNLEAETWDCPFSGVMQAFDFLPGLLVLAQRPRQERTMSTALPLVGSRQGVRR
jgi:penicillin-binding protein-related factor A (putative recombinase)